MSFRVFLDTYHVALEALYLLEEESRIVGISKYAIRPKRARQEKEVVCTFINANLDKIISLKPDLVIGFSDIQADIAKNLIKKGRKLERKL